MDSNVDILELSRSELIGALSTYKNPILIGMKLPEWDLPKDELQAMLEDGKKSLAERNLASFDRGNGDLFNLGSSLERFIAPLVLRDLAVVVVLGSKGYGRYLIIYNVYEDLIIEHFVNEDGSHTLTNFKDIGSVFERFTTLIPLQAIVREGRQKFEVTQDQFELAVKLSKEGGEKKKIQRTLKKTGLDEEYLPKITNALFQPLFSLSMACFVCKGNQAVEASSTTVFADADSAWGIWPKDMDADPPLLWLMPTGINDIHSTLIDWFGIREQLIDAK